MRIALRIKSLLTGINTGNFCAKQLRTKCKLGIQNLLTAQRSIHALNGNRENLRGIRDFESLIFGFPRFPFTCPITAAGSTG